MKKTSINYLRSKSTTIFSAYLHFSSPLKLMTPSLLSKPSSDTSVSFEPGLLVNALKKNWWSLALKAFRKLRYEEARRIWGKTGKIKPPVSDKLSFFLHTTYQSKVDLKPIVQLVDSKIATTLSADGNFARFRSCICEFVPSTPVETSFAIVFRN